MGTYLVYLLWETRSDGVVNMVDIYIDYEYAVSQLRAFREGHPNLTYRLAEWRVNVNKLQP